MLKALADRLAEAFAEYMHLEVRKNHWGYIDDEDMRNEELVKEMYKIRPAPGYPACPDHTEKAKLFELLNVQANTTITLTESFAILICYGISWYFSHPASQYFCQQNYRRTAGRLCQAQRYNNRRNRALAGCSSTIIRKSL